MNEKRIGIIMNGPERRSAGRASLRDAARSRPSILDEVSQ